MANGATRTFRRTGYDRSEDAHKDLDTVRALLGLPDNDLDRTQVGDPLEQLGKSGEKPPDVEDIRRQLRVGQPLGSKLTVGNWLDQWMSGESHRRATEVSYESHIRLYLRPHIGDIPLDRPQVPGRGEPQARQRHPARHAQRRHPPAGCSSKRTAREYRPSKITALFVELYTAAGLPPIRLHDLRHGAATIALTAGTDAKVVSEMLGHSETRVTRDTYQSVLPAVAREAAEAAINIVPRVSRTDGHASGTHRA